MSNKKEPQQWALEQLAKIDKEQPDLREMEMRSFADMVVWGSNYWHVDEKGNRRYIGPFRDRHYITGDELDTE